LGGTYPIGKIAQEKYDVGYKAAAEFINAKPNEVGESKAYQMNINHRF